MIKRVVETVVLAVILVWSATLYGATPVDTDTSWSTNGELSLECGREDKMKTINQYFYTVLEANLDKRLINDSIGLTMKLNRKLTFEEYRAIIPADVQSHYHSRIVKGVSAIMIDCENPQTNDERMAVFVAAGNIADNLMHQYFKDMYWLYSSWCQKRDIKPINTDDERAPLTPPTCGANVTKMFIDDISPSAIDFIDSDGDGIADGAILYTYDEHGYHIVMVLSVAQAEALTLAYLVGPDQIPGTQDDGAGRWVECGSF